jgi:ubiquitin carboxyl-terminal hydrolase 25
MPSNYEETEAMLHPPATDVVTSQGRQNRAKLLRAWVELGAWLTDYQRRYGEQAAMEARHIVTYEPPVSQLRAQDIRLAKLSVKVDSAREMYQNAIGAHPDQSKSFHFS